jgi:hypothetical protein
MKLKTIKARLESILGSVAGDGNDIAHVLTYLKPLPQNYPCAMVMNGESELMEDELTNTSDEWKYGFIIRVVVAPDDQISAETEGKISDVIELILGTFLESDYIETLGGYCTSFRINRVVPFSESDPTPSRGVDFFCSAQANENHT